MVSRGARDKRERMSLQPQFKLSFEGAGGRTMVDQIDALLLRHVSEKNSLTEAAKATGISYRNAWNRMNRLESNLGDRILKTKVGGREGGGAVLTDSGLELLKEFRRVRRYLFDALEERDFWGQASFKLSARNRIRARVTAVRKGSIISEVNMVSTDSNILTSIISNEAVDELGLREGDHVEAIIKSTEVMIAKPGKM